MESLNSASALQAELTSELEQYQPRRGRDYAAVTALMLVWEDDDLGCIKEVRQLSVVLEEKFHYQVRQFLIPSERPQSSLSRAISDFLYQYGSPGNLALIYYGGHGDPDLEGDRDAVWAALKHGGPTLRWHYIQPSLEAAECDVLILLDCCFAGQAARARLSHRVEILAAAAMGLRTPGVGQKYPSFTQVLITEMSRILEQQQHVNVVALHREMLKKTHRLQQQPLHITLSGDPSGSIVLRGLSRSSSGESPTKTPSSLVLRVSLFEPPDSTQKDQILRWMTSATPSVVSAITVEKTFLVAQGATLLGERMLEDRAHRPGRESEFNIPQAARPALLASFTRLKSMMNRPIVYQNLAEDLVLQAVQEIQEACEGFLDAFRDCMSTFEPSLLQILAVTPETAFEGLAERVSMRLRLLEALPPTRPLDYGKVQFATQAKDKERFRIGTQGGTNVFVEYYYHGTSSPIEDKDSVSALIQVRKIAALHAEPKDSTFCMLLGRGYTHERLYGPRFGLIYELPEQHVSSSYFKLSECYRPFSHVPLETRIHLAYRVSMAVCSMHSIGWLHKAIKSQNIIFFGLASDTRTVDSSQPTIKPNFKAPHVFGFDCSRPEAAESSLEPEWDPRSNLYRHPDRWGRPVRFKKVHDIYALGVLLLEVAFWRPVHALDPESKGFSRVSDPEQLRLILLGMCKDRLCHVIGQRYAEATEICLTRGLGDDLEDWEFQQHIREHVVQKLV